jgi:hypothetical protein
VSGAPAQSTSWIVGVEPVGGGEQVRHALLPGDPPDEEDVGAAGVDAVAVERVGGRARGVQLGVDAVVDDVHRAGSTNG